MKKSSKKFFEKGYATTIFMLFLIIMFLMITVVMNKIACKYVLRVKAQTWLDSAVHGASVMGCSRNGFDETKARAAFDEIASIAKDDFKYDIKFDMQIDSDIITGTAVFEYPWMASGSSNSVTGFVSTYPTMTVSSETQYIFNGNEDIINREYAIPSDRTQKVNISYASEDPDALKETYGDRITKDTLIKIANQLTSQDIGRYKYTGYDTTWCGNVSAQTLFTQDIMMMLGDPGYFGLNTESMLIYNNTVMADYNQWNKLPGGGSTQFEDLSTYNVFSGTLGTAVVDGNEYILINPNINTRTSQVLTPDGIKNMTFKDIDNIEWRIYNKKLTVK